MVLVVGLVGRIGSGKGTISDFIVKECGGSKHVFSQILMDVCDRLHVPKTRENLQALGVSLRKELGGDILVNAMAEDLKKDNSSVVVVDGIRYINEFEMVKDFKKSIILFVDAPVSVRYERCKERGTKGEGEMSLDEFTEKDNNKTESEIDSIGTRADYVIDNSGRIEELREKILEIINKSL